MNIKAIIRLLSPSALPFIICLSAHAQTTAFTYQGRLNDANGPATGLYDLAFTLYDSASSRGNTVGAGAITNAATPVTNGLFTVTLDFGWGVFDGNARWLELAVQPAGGTNFATLAPRQALTATPYAQFAGSTFTAGFANFANGVSGMNILGQVPLSKLPAQVLTNGAAFVGDGTGVTNVNAVTLNGATAANFWQLGGNGSAPGQFLGTTNTQAMEIWAGNQRALRLEPTVPSAPNVIAGAVVNFAGAGVAGATIGGGGALNYYGNKHTNSVTADFGTVSGGSRNTVSGMIGSVGGGFNNTASGQLAVVAGGQNNLADGMYAIVAGGYGGHAGNNNATVGGGQNNLAAGMYSTVVGGYGGWAGNSYATVAGGYDNYALGQSSFAAGHMAQAQHDGSFVWADNSSSMSFSSVYSNEFAVRAAGGVRLVTSGAGINVDGQITGTSLWGNGVGLTNVNAATFNGNGPANFWLLSGNNVSAGQFIGSTNNQPLEFKVNGSRALLLDYGNANFGGNVWIGTNCSVATLTIRGGADLAEPFNITSGNGDAPAGAVVVIDEQNPGRLKLSDKAYDTHVAGVVSGANGVNPGIQMHQQGLIEGGKNIALTGRVYVQADASNGAIRPGDMLTTASCPGFAMKASDHTKSVGAILGKAMTGLKEGKGLVLVLVTLQ
ncbi:MAG: hypothetical protein WCH99_15735 [Verrucomicrobiota bacterium]